MWLLLGVILLIAGIYYKIGGLQKAGWFLIVAPFILLLVIVAIVLAFGTPEVTENQLVAKAESIVNK